LPRALIVALLAFLAFCPWLDTSVFAASTTTRFTKGGLLAETPISIVNNRIQLTLQVEGYELLFALDTGASRTVLFQSNDYSFDDLPTTGEARVAFPALDEIVGGITLAPLNIMVNTHAFHAARPLLIKQRPPIGDRLSFKFDGILGRDFFERYVIQIDPKQLTLRLYTAGTDLSKQFKTILPLYMNDGTAHIRFRTKLPWEETPSMKDMMLDTGYPGAMVIWKPRHFKQAANHKETEHLIRENMGIVTRANFRLSKLKFINVPVFLAPKEPVQAHQRDGILGNGILIQFHHVFDFGTGKLLLSGNSDLRAQRIYQLDSFVYPPNNEQFIIKQYLRPLLTGPGNQ